MGLEAQVRFPITAPLSNSVQDLIRKCLTPSMKNRIDLQDILNHQWFSLTEKNNNMHSSLPRVSAGNTHENSNFRSQNQQDTESNQISIYLQPVSGSSSLSSEGPGSIPTQSTEITISGNGNCHEEKSNIRSKIQLPTGNTQISSLKSTTSLAVIESQIETMVVKSCHKPIFRKLVKLLMVPISFLFAGLRSGCIVGEMV